MSPVPSDVASGASASDTGARPWPTPTHLALIRAAFELDEDLDP